MSFHLPGLDPWSYHPGRAPSMFGDIIFIRPVRPNGPNEDLLRYLVRSVRTEASSMRMTPALPKGLANPHYHFTGAHYSCNDSRILTN